MVVKVIIGLGLVVYLPRISNGNQFTYVHLCDTAELLGPLDDSDMPEKGRIMESNMETYKM